jgi:hypothetical protein
MINLLYIMLFVLIIALYAFTSSVAVGVAAIVVFAAILVLEAKESLKGGGMKKGIFEILVAVAAAVIAWYILVLILGTQSPIDAVASCSMLPTLHRGDMVVLRGIGNASEFASSTGIPVINMSMQEFNAMENNISSEFNAFFAYSKSNMSQISEVAPGAGQYGIGLYNTQCISSYTYLGQSSKIAKCFVPSQNGSAIKYGYSEGSVSISGINQTIIYTSRISASGRNITENYSNPIIVYRATSRDSFSGDIIHRVYAAINVDGRYYFLTKGDNNPALDMEFANYPVNQSDVVGYVILKIPALGYIKLLMSGQLGSVPGCNILMAQKG